MAASFREAQRCSTGLLTRLERRALLWFAERMPSVVNSDHLTALALFSMFMVGVSYALSSRSQAALGWSVVWLALNWFGDSLDGTLARVRGHQRPRYGFYVDHLFDSFGAIFVLGGLALSGRMTPIIAALFLVAYLLLTIEIFLATYCVGRFQMSFWGLGPTELRILVAIGTLTLFVTPTVTFAGMQLRLFDAGGIAGTVLLAVTTLVATVRHVRFLFLAEPLPSTLPESPSGVGIRAGGAPCPTPGPRPGASGLMPGR
jgi:phosphatidylglycerophosphate synthase